MKKHMFYYVSLVVLLCVGFSLATYFSGRQWLQMLFITITAVFYIIWGIVHHTLNHSFSLKVMLEYIAIAIFGIAITLFVLNIGL